MTKADINDILIPVNPDYHWEGKADEQPEYVNPVTASNREILLANKAILVGQQIAKLHREQAEAKATLKDAQAELADFERELLLKHPPKTTHSKTLKLLDAYILDLVKSTGKQDDYRSLVSVIRQQERSLAMVEARLDGAKVLWQSIKLAGEHVQTFLSFWKSEQRDARKYT